MTKKEYVQSLKDKGVKKAEALELLNQWDIDNKPTEVEKPQATAPDAAPVVAENQAAGTESKPENTSLALQEIDSKNLSSKKPEVEEDKKPTKYKIPKNNIGLPRGDEVDILETITITDDFKIPEINLDPVTTSKLKTNYNYNNLEKELLSMFERDKDKENPYLSAGNLNFSGFDLPVSDIRKVYENYKETGKVDAELISDDYKVKNRQFDPNKNLVELRKLNIPLTKPIKSTVIKKDDGTKVKGIKDENIGNYYAPVYMVDGEEIIGNPIAIKDDAILQENVRLKDVEVTADDGGLDLTIKEPNNEKYEVEKDLLNKKIQEEKDPIKKKELKKQLSELNDNQIKEQQDYQNSLNKNSIYNTYNTIDVNVNKPSANEIVPTVFNSRYFKKDENGKRVPVKAYNPYEGNIFFGGDEYEGSRQASKLNPRSLTKKINDKYINHGLAAVADGDDVYVYKNAIFDDNGDLNYNATLEANGLGPLPERNKFGEAFYDKRNFNKLMEKEGLAKSIQVGKGIFLDQLFQRDEDPKKVAGFLDFIDENSTEYEKSTQVPKNFSGTDRGITKSFKEIEKKQKDNLNVLQKKYKRGEEILSEIEDLNLQIEEEGGVVTKKFGETETVIKDINKKFVDEVKEKREQLRLSQIKNPQNTDKLFEDYKNWEDKAEEKRLRKVNSAIDGYKELYEEEFERIDKIREEKGVLNLEVEEIGQVISNNLSTYNMLDASKAMLRNTNTERFEKLSGQKTKLSEGNPFLEVYNIFAEQFATVTVGKVSMMQNFAEGINELGHTFNFISDGEYKMYKGTFKSQEASMESQIKSITDTLVGYGNSEAYSARFAETLVGGTVQAFTQMAASAFGAPVSGLFGGFFYSSLAQAKIGNNKREKKFIEERVKNGMSEADAQAEYEQAYPKSRQLMYSYTQAAVEGALSHLSGKILSGKIPGKGGDELVNRITNHILRKVANGNVTAKELQIYVNNYIGNNAAKLIRGGKKFTTTGLFETIEETTQFYAAFQIDEWMQGKTDNKVDFEVPDYDSEEFKQQRKHMMQISFLAGAGGAAFEMASNPAEEILNDKNLGTTYEQRQKNDKLREYYADTARDANQLQNKISKISSDPKLKQNQKEELILEAQNTFNLYSQIDSDLSGTAQFEMAYLLQQKLDLEAKKKKLAKGSTGRIDKQIDAINTQMAEISGDSNNVKVDKSKVKSSLEKQLVISTDEKVKQDNKQIEETIREENPDLTEQEVQEQVEANKIQFDPKSTEVRIFSPGDAQALANEYNIDMDQLVDENGDFRMEGSYLPNSGVILLSEDAAAKGADIHEGTHLFTDIAFSKPENKNIVYALADKVLKQIRKTDPQGAAILEQQLDKYRADENYDGNAVMQEVMPFYTQLRKIGYFDQNNSVSKQLKRGVRRLYQNLGMELNLREDNILEILNDYSDNLEEGNITTAQKKAIQGKIKVDPKLRNKGNILAKQEELEQAEEAKKKEDTKVIPIQEEIDSVKEKMVASKKLSPKETTTVKEKIADLKQEIKENTELAKRFNKEPIATSKQRRLEQEIFTTLEPTVESFIKSQTKRLYDPIAPDARRGITREKFADSMRNDINSMIVDEYQDKQDIEKFIVNRGYLRANSLAERLGIASVEQGISKDVNDQAGLSTGEDFTNTLDDKPMPSKRSKIKQQVPSLVDPQLEREIESAVLEIKEGVRPDVDSKEFRPFIKEVLDAKLTNKIKNKFGKGKDYDFFIKKLAPKLKDIMPAQYFVKLESQTKPENRIFTEPGIRLTKQADIDEAMRNDQVYVENTAQGARIYNKKNFTAKQLEDFLLAPAISPETGKKSGLKGNRKTSTAQSMAEELGKDMIPSVFKGDKDAAKVSLKSQRPPDQLFSLKFDEDQLIEMQEASQWRDKNKIAKELGFNSDAIKESNRDDFQDQILKAAELGFVDKAVIEAGAMGSGGRQTFYGDKNNKFKNYGAAKKAGIKNIGKYFKTKDNNFYRFGDVVVNQRGKVIVENKNKYKDQIASVDPSLWVAKPGRLFWSKEDPAYKKLLETASDSPFDENGYRQISISKKGKFIGKKALVQKLDKKVGDTNMTQSEINMKMLDHVVNQLANAVDNGMSMDIAGMVIIQSYQATGGLIKASAPFEGVSNVFEAGKKIEIRSEKLYREEHNPPASVVGASILTAIKMNKPKAVMADIRKNFSQTILSKKDDSKLDVNYAATLPEGVSINDNPIIRMAMAGINLNTVTDLRTGQTYADKFGLGVAETVQTFPGVISLQNKLISDVVLGEVDLKDAKKRLATYTKFPNNRQPSLAKTQNDASIVTSTELKESKVLDIDEDLSMEELLSKAASVDEALKLANSLDRPIKKIRVFDFDDTLATSNNKVFAVRGDETIEMNAEKFATDAAQMIQDGWTMDFSDFDNVTDGGRGPLFEVAKTIKEARGNEDLFVLTARSPNAEQAIYDFLKAEGLEFKRKNIVGLGKSPGEAKANWIINKAAEGYNDFYFADDAFQNVKAVRDVLSVVDVKSKVQQAKMQESKKLGEEFNMLLEETTGIDSFKEYSAAKAKTIGASKGNFKFFIPYSAEDFLGLIYPTLTKGSKGDAQMAWYKENLLDPYTKAQENLSTARLNLMNDFKQLKKSLNVPKDLKKKNDSGFTNEQAVRVNLFTSMGYEVPGLSKRDLKELNDTVNNDPKLKEFAEQILTITKGDGYSKPDQNWLVGTITTDLINLINTEKRSKYLSNWQERVDAIYTPENLNKLEAQYGTKYREALENILSRMKSGKNRTSSGSKVENQILDYINGSIGTIMFFNTRSAVLQTLSAINFVNWSFNNPLKAGKAFANQKQYWSDFKELMNSDYLLDRRNGLKLNINESEIADAAATSKNKAKAAINYILQKGYLPTQYADSFAIASGGASFYRNRINDLVSKGMSEIDAKKQAMIEFRQIAEQSQQSSDPSKISAQQSSNAGRLILAFANTPMQYTRLQKRAIQDLINGRGDAKANISKVIYYGFVQNLMFNALQQAFNVFGFGDDEEDENPNREKKFIKVANGMLDSLLRGLGIGGAAVSVGKNFLMDIYERSQRKRPEYVDSVWKLTQFSPPINSKISRLKQAAWHFDSKKRREKIYDKGFALDNPAYEAAAKVVSATTNIPVDRVINKANNIEAALNEDLELWKRVAMLAGWPQWQLEDPKTPAVATPEEKAEKKSETKVQNYKNAKGSTDNDVLKKLTADQQIKMLKSLGFGEYTIKNARSEQAKIDLIIAKNSKKKIKIDQKAVDEYKYKKLNKDEQVRKLDSLGLSKSEIAKLKYEKDRVKKLLELMK